MTDSDATSIKWESPPPDGRTRGWSEVAAALRARPGEWAMVAEDASLATAGNIRRGRYQGFTDGEFEVTFRRGDHNPQRGRIYARFTAEMTA